MLARVARIFAQRVGYLQKAVDMQLFPELWRVRTQL